MNIIDIIKEKQSIYNFTYYGVGDYATGFDVDELINNYDKIKEYFDSKFGEIKSYDDFIDYLYLRKYSFFAEVKQYLKDEVKPKFEIAYNFICEKLKQYTNKELLNYLKENAIEIINSKRNSIISVIFDLIFHFHSPCKDIILHIAKTKHYLILTHFNDVKNVLIKYNEVCLEILKPEHFEQSKKFMLNKYFNMIKYFNRKKEYEKEVQVIINSIVEYENEILKTIDSDNTLQYESIYKDIVLFLKEIKHKSYVLFEKSLPEIETKLSQYLEKHGQSFSFEIPIKDIMKPFENEKNSLQTKLLLLTHSHTNGKLQSYFTNVGESNEKSLTDELFSTSTPHDDYFTIMKQQILNYSDYAYLTCLHYFVSSARIDEFISMLAALTLEVCKHYNIDFEELEFEDDFNILLNMFHQLFVVSKNNNDYLEKGLNYSISMFFIGVIEKFLRNLFVSQNTDEYIKGDFTTLGDLLNTKNKTITDLLGIHNVKIMSYYLLQNENNIGQNYRNNFAHYKNIKTKDMNFGKVLKITQIFLCIINELLVKIK